MTKPSNHPSHVSLVPNKIPERLFGIITTNFITDLPKCEGYNVIHFIIDQLTKDVILSLYRKTINTDGTVDILLKGIFQHYGLWNKMISNQGLQFASKVMQAIHAKLDITSTLSMAYYRWQNQALQPET